MSEIEALREGTGPPGRTSHAGIQVLECGKSACERLRCRDEQEREGGQKGRAGASP
ncbi:MAG TPA: hypothetical protein VMY43_00565 [Methanothrix sp.]|nr:hypothetical protein [Methanothrix sp.]